LATTMRGRSTGRHQHSAPRGDRQRSSSRRGPMRSGSGGDRGDRGERGDRGDRGDRRRGGGKPARFYSIKGEKIDYKNLSFLQRYLTDRGKILSRRFTGISAGEQRELTAAIKNARFLGLLPVGRATA